MRRMVWACLAAFSVWMVGCRERKRAPATASSASSAPAPSASVAVSHEGTRPPRPRVRADARPPNLPRLSAQAPHVMPSPSKPKPDFAPCGVVWTGDEHVPLDCYAPAEDEHFGSPAVALVPYDVLRAPKGELPATVDHRADGFEGRTLAQGSVGACTAFSLVSQINHAIGLWTGTSGDVSVMQAWARYHRSSGWSGLRANIGRALATDAEWPYDAARAGAWGKCKGGDECLSDEERHKLAALDGRGVAVLEEIERLPSNDSLFDVMEAKLAAGQDIGTGGKLGKHFHPIGEPGSRYVPDPDPNEIRDGKGSHAFSLVGYTHVDGERYFLIKNSWGERWGDQGYAWIHERSLAKMVNAAYAVVVDPAGAVGLRRHRRRRSWVAACPAGEAPDSIDGGCQPLCADGGPRHDGHCGVTDDCTRGFVNTAGECVLSAPRVKGVEPKNGITFACAPSGCVYTVPKGALGCAEARCQKSCPAPDYRLGRGKGGLLCLE